MVNKDNASPAFVGLSGRFYIRQSRASGSGYTDRVTVCPSVADYDQRNPVQIDFFDIAEAVLDFDRHVKVYPENLKTTPPDADTWEREQPADDYRNRELWKSKFTKTRARHVA